MTSMLLVYRYRVKSLNGLLNQQSRAVNYCGRRIKRLPWQG
ncbi:hypothetical protein [Cupriavidus lacunae]|nr:hypothetical protein [Cupriavidus lacunae]